MRAAREDRILSSNSNRSGVEMGSSEQVLGADFVISLLTITSVVGSNIDREIIHLGR